jgi:glycosyltransferase involved in cell wall biosynthesis
VRVVINGWFRDQLTTGSGQYLAALTEWLPRVREAHEFVLLQHAGKPVSDGEGMTCVTATTPFDSLSDNLAKLWFEQVAFPVACRRLRADVAFVPYWGAPWWSPCPLVVTIHDLIPLLLPAYRGGILQRSYTWLVGRTARRAAAILTDSGASRRDIVRHLGIEAQRIYAVHLAASPHFRRVDDPVTLAQVREKYGLSGEPFLLYLGGFDVRKNVPRLLEAYSRLVQSLASGALCVPCLVIAGRLPATDTEFAPDPRLIVERLGLADHVRLLGWVDETDKPALYTLAAGTLFVSEYEGFGLPVLESMACDGRT